MKIIFLHLLFLVFGLFLTACGSDTNNRNNTNTFNQTEKEFVHNLFLTEYLWYDKVDLNVDYDTYIAPQSLVTALSVTPPDRWSFTMTSKTYDDYVNQKTEGFGFGHTPAFIIYLVRIGAPAHNKLFRGDKIIKVNGQTASKSIIEDAKNSIGKSSTFSLLRDGNEIEVNITPRSYAFGVTSGKVITQNYKKIGYLRYGSFSEASVAQLEKEFTQFKKSNINELVIDLRYNGGGSVSVASTLLDNITYAYAGERQGYLDWNENFKNENENFYFSDEIESNDLNMKRVFFLVTKSSASASELVISSLMPYLGKTNVVTVGTATHGKNVGMKGKTYGNNYYFLVNFFVRNNAGESIGFDGIPATCSADDDLSHQLGDPSEKMLKTALYYIQNNQCP